METKQPKIISIAEAFQNKNLKIPDYQRPYKWTEKNVKQLLDDIRLNKESNDYRFGTIVVHQENDHADLDIVDGQQRMLTLSLIYLAIKETYSEKGFYSKFKNINSSLLELKFDNLITQKNLKTNYNVILREVRNFDESTINFFYHHCKVVWVVISDISEAFQFFDSQNSRGKDLYPQDLLKAFHLREMAKNSDEEKKTCVEYWENLDQKKLDKLFKNYLYRIRNWSKGRSAEEFTKDDVGVFKGITLDNNHEFNYIKSYKINHFYTEMYNNDINRNIDGQKLEYPFQLDQIMINGKRFFEFITHYSKEVENIKDFNNDLNQVKIKIKDTKTKALEILDLLDTYDARYRTGDLYVRNVFNCCLLYYIDKFGYYKIDEIIVRFFIWVYTPRIEKHSVRLKTIDNLGKNYQGFFRIIRESINTKEIFYKELGIIKPYNGNFKKESTKPLIDIFDELNYISK
ncbi:DUF262 domain-containing protein [Polaribacter undariae]|uniref:DUF262 domain-containing protein n=1 Tax=Polaribacter sejongensis TaxID=985043 RepID=A0AAJ1QWJ2_9FLAO|nr:DUF262 domain-containing protein [Polaribacter undariae]MDN3619395.1 DUF262 domain-containing protein [Polaribacter undariae]UWD33405.1 DUF262 domain-containing protein [Polaribacter undariae]